MFRTAWGEPDLQGIWSYATITPLERPVALGDKEYFTEEEAAKRDADAVAALDRPPRPGDTGTYNGFWWDRGATMKNRRTSRILDPKNGRLPPLTPEAQKRRADRAAYLKEHPADSWLDLPVEDRCIIYHGVPPGPSGYNNTYQIVQTPGLVAILDENIHHVRMIPVGDQTPPNPDIRQWNGISRGRWENDTLVVETTNYSEKTQLRFPSSENTRAVERFRRVDRDTIDYQFTIHDPTVYTAPWTAMLPMQRTDGLLYEYACHEGNRSMSGILGGARHMEKEAAEAGAKAKK
jgi:hypothetical protein